MKNSVWTVPPVLHEVFGEQSRWSDLGLIAAVAGLVTAAFAFTMDGPSGWRGGLALVLVADIAAGAIANLTLGTNQFYAIRPRKRWVFIAIHVHILALAWLVEARMGPAFAAWGVTMLGAVLCNLRFGGASQAALGGGLSVLGALVVVVAMPPEQPMLAFVYLLFLGKVVFAFGVDHFPPPPGEKVRSAR